MFCIRNYWEVLIAIPGKVAVSIKAGLTHDEDVRYKLICNNNVVEIKKMDPRIMIKKLMETPFF